MRGRLATLSPTLARLLSLLTHASPRTVSKQELLDGAWPERVVSEAALTQRIKELRKLLADDARHPRLIGTVTGKGYRLLEEAVPLAAGSPASTLQRRRTAVAVVVQDFGGDGVAGGAFRSILERALRASEAVSPAPPERLRAAARFLRLPERRFERGEEEALTVARRAGTVAFLVAARLRRLDATYLAELRIGDVAGAREQFARLAAKATTLYRAQALFWQGMEMVACGDRAGIDDVIGILRNTPVGSVHEFGSPMPRRRERVHRFLPLLLAGERALVEGDAADALQAFSEAVGGLPAVLDAPVPLATTGPRLHLAAREGTARALAALGRSDEAYAAESWIVDRRLLLFVASQGGVGVWIASLARRAAVSLARGRRTAAMRDAGEVIARWGGLVPEPPAVRVARRVALEAGGA